MKKLERHALSKLWPDIPDAQFNELRTDIDKHGLQYPITLYNGQILDGWNRYRACLDLRKKPDFKTFKGTPAEAADFVNSLNAHRRNVAEGIRAFAITGAYEWAQANTKGTLKGDTCHPSVKTNEAMATEAGSSKRTVQRAKKVHKSGSAALKEAVKSGEVPLNKAAAVVDLPKSEQLAAAKAPIVPTSDEPDRPHDVTEADETAALEAAEKELSASLDKILKADDKLATAYAEIKRQAAEIASLKTARNGWMNENKAAIRLAKDKDKQISALERENKKLKDEITDLKERVSIMEAA